MELLGYMPEVQSNPCGHNGLRNMINVRELIAIRTWCSIPRDSNNKDMRTRVKVTRSCHVLAGHIERG